MASAFLAASGDDVDDLERGERLPVTRLAAVVLAAPELEDRDLGPQALADDLGLDLRAADEGATERQLLAADEEHLVERDGVPDVARDLLDAELVALCDPV